MNLEYNQIYSGNHQFGNHQFGKICDVFPWKMCNLPIVITKAGEEGETLNRTQSFSLKNFN